MRQSGAGVVIKAIPGGLAVKHEASKVVPSLMPVVPSLDKVQREKKKMMTTTMMTPDKREDMFEHVQSKREILFLERIHSPSRWIVYWISSQGSDNAKRIWSGKSIDHREFHLRFELNWLQLFLQDCCHFARWLAIKHKAFWSFNASQPKPPRIDLTWFTTPAQPCWGRGKELSMKSDSQPQGRKGSQWQTA